MNRRDHAVPERDARAVDPLTKREIQVLELVAAGERTSAIGRRLGIAENTVKAHLTSIYRKTGSRNRVQAARYYLERLAVDGAQAERLQDALAALRSIEPS